MLDLCICFCLGLILGVLIKVVLEENEKEMNLKRHMKNIFEEYFCMNEFNSNMICPFCEGNMELNMKLISVSNEDIISLIFICPSCGSEVWI